MKTTEILPDALRPGQRVVVSFGIVTIRGIKIGGDSVTLYWHEPQPAVMQSRWNTVEVIQ